MEQKYTEQQLKDFDWTASVSNDLDFACAALNDMAGWQEGRMPFSVGPLECYTGNREDAIPCCHKCGKAPKAWIEGKTLFFGCKCGELTDNFIAGNDVSALYIIRTWSKMQMFFTALKTGALDVPACQTALSAHGYKRVYEGMAKNEYVAGLQKPLDSMASVIDSMSKSENLDATMEGYAIVLKDIVRQMLGILKLGE